MADQLTSTGIEIDTLDERLDEIRSDLRSNISTNLDLSTDTPIGQFVSIIGEKIQSVAELVEEAYGQFDPDQATGTSLSSLSRITGTVKQQPTKGTTTLTLDLDAATTVPSGSIVAVSGDADNQWETDAGVTSVGASIKTGTITMSYNDNSPAADTIVRSAGDFIVDGFAASDVIEVSGTTSNDGFYTIASLTATTITLSTSDALTDESSVSSELKADTYTVAATAVESGVYNAAAGTITSIVSAVTGWNAVTNAAAANPGEDLETDTELRLRREREITTNGSGSVASIQSAISAVEGVIDVTVYNNPSPVSISTVPAPHAFHSIVWDGLVPSAVNADLAEAIFDNAPAGIRSYGSTNVSYTDSQGLTHTISFSRPSIIDVDVTIKVFVNSEYSGDSAVQTAISTVIDAVPPGEDVFLSDVISAANGVAGVEYVDLTGTAPTLDKAGAGAAFADVLMDSDEKASANTVSVTSEVV